VDLSLAPAGNGGQVIFVQEARKSVKQWRRVPHRDRAEPTVSAVPEH